jgi:hypothetical protein
MQDEVYLAFGILPVLMGACFCCYARRKQVQRAREDLAKSEWRGMPALSDRAPCCVCGEFTSDVLFEPCRHDQFCARCGAMVWMTSRACPLCRRAIDRIVHGDEPIWLTAGEETVIEGSLGSVVHRV